MKISKFISDIITNYEQNHKPLNIDILMRLIYEANNKVKICYNITALSKIVRKLSSAGLLL
jgi:phenylalanine-4-hydroxylase